MLFVLGVIAILTLIVYYISRPLRERGLFPPGPRPLPLFGNLLAFRGSKKSTFDDALEMGKTYGDGKSVTFWFGMNPNVILNSFQGVKEALIDNQHDFASRPDMGSFTESFFEGSPDIIFGPYTAQWHAMKKLGAKVIRRVIDSNRLESNVTEATDKLIESLKAQDLSKPVEMQNYTTNCVYSILAALCFGVQYSIDDLKFLELLELRRKGNEVPPTVFLLMLLPGANRFPKLLNIFPQWREMMKNNEKQMDFLQYYIDDHKQTRKDRLGTDEELRDVLDALHIEQEEAQKAGEDLSNLTDGAAKMIIFDIFGAGTETTATTLRWFVLEMALNPDIQEACAEQIRSVVGDGVPTLQDKQSLPLVEACMLETLRLHPAAPLAVAHAPSSPNVKLFGKYPVPSDSTIMYNIWGIHRDPELFADPWKFDPSRYLDGNETYKPFGWIPFGVGRRVCMGETLAKNDLFLVCTGLLQRLRFKTVPDEDYTRYPDVINGLTNIPKSGQKFLIELR